MAKNGFWSKNFFREYDLFDFTSFFGLDFFKFSGSLFVIESHGPAGQILPQSIRFFRVRNILDLFIQK